MAADYEKLGLFYLGKRYDLASNARLDDRSSTTRRISSRTPSCVGMTGSGKTGLGIALIEEAAIDGIPVLAIDPKGDLANLLLTFPDLARVRLRAVGRRRRSAAQSMTVEAFAADRRAAWKAGLAEWDQDGDRIARLQAGGRRTRLHAGQPRRHAARDARVAGAAAPTRPRKMRASAIASTAASLLGLAGIDRCSAAQPRAGAALDDPASARTATASRGSAVAGAADSAAVVRSRRRARPRNILPGARIARSWRCASTACWPRRASTSGSRVIRSTPGRCSSRADGQAAHRHRLDRAPRRRRTDARRVAAAQCRCSSGRAGRAARARCAR